MGLSEAVGEVLGIPEPSARFLLALFSGEFLECAHNCRSPRVCNVWMASLCPTCCTL